MATVLSIETSCDETAVAIVNNRNVLSDIVSSQIELHGAYGGVVPEMASRLHLESIDAAIRRAVDAAGVGWGDIDAIAATAAPGLVGALLVGLSAAKTLAIVHNIPFLGIHHLEGHIYANYLAKPDLEVPFLCVLVSGGHTCLLRVDGCGKYQQIGTTRDDAAGEAFDKVARLLSLPYPGGPAIDRLAATGDPCRYPLPEGNISQSDGSIHPYDSSFSGVKTAVLRLVQKLSTTEKTLPVADIAASFQTSVAKAITKRAITAAKDGNLKTIALGGGVAANSGLRQTIAAAAAKEGIEVLLPPLKYCTDNAAMIGAAACDRFDLGFRSDLSLGALSRLAISESDWLYASRIAR
jgi:N6-L-threonylcarbamoyladenine synthase